jgi:hypothetical protein
MSLECFLASPISGSAVERAQIALKGNESHEAAARLLGRWIKKARIDCERRKTMLWTIFVILLVLWLLGLVTSYTMGGLIHILLVVALIVFVLNLLQGRKVA